MKTFILGFLISFFGVVLELLLGFIFPSIVIPIIPTFLIVLSIYILFSKGNSLKGQIKKIFLGEQELNVKIIFSFIVLIIILNIALVYFGKNEYISISKFNYKKLLLIILIYIPGVIEEEVIYRFFIMNRIENRIKKILLSSLIFLIPHLIAIFINNLFTTEKIYSISYISIYSITIFLSGVFFSAIYLITQSILTTSVIHLIWNVLTFIFIPNSVLYNVLILGVLLVALLIYYKKCQSLSISCD